LFRFSTGALLFGALIVALIGKTGHARADERVGLSLAAVDASQVTVVQSSSSFAATGRLAWVPGYYFSPWFGVRVDLGVALLKEANDQELGTDGGLYPATNAAALTDFVLGGLALSGGGGAAFWHDSPFSRATLLTGRVAWLPRGDLGGWIDRVYLGYSYLRFQAVHAREIALGLGISL
jgi:hypothetical protein